MGKRARHRINRNSRGRRLVLLLGVIGLALVSGWALEKNYSVFEQLKWAIDKLVAVGQAPEASRGEIFDRNLKQLAVTMSQVSVYLRSREVVEVDETISRLETVLDIDGPDLRRQLESGALRVWVAGNIDQDQEKAIRRLQLPGVHLQTEQRRYYPNSTQAAHLLGFTEAGLGLAGVEAYYDRLITSQTLADGSKGLGAAREPAIVLHLDLKIQSLLEDVLTQLESTEGFRSAALYLMDSHSGGIIGSGQRPSYDPTNFAQHSRVILRNRFFDITPLPTTFLNLFRDSALLHSAVENGVEEPLWSLSQAELPFASQLMFLESSGLGSKMTVDFMPLVIEAEKREPASDLRRNVGLVEMFPASVAPINLLSACAFLFNGGKSIMPQAVKSAMDQQSGQNYDLSVYDGESQVQPHAFVVPDWEQLFMAIATRGESKAQFLEDRSISLVGRDSSLLAHEYLLVKIPSGTRALTLLLVVDRTLSLPVKKQVPNPAIALIDQVADRISILDQVARSVSDVVEPEEGPVGNYPQKEEADASPRQKNLHAAPDQVFIMPELAGLSLRKALRLLEGAGCEMRVEGSGVIYGQEPPARSRVETGDTCRLLLRQPAAGVVTQ